MDRKSSETPVLGRRDALWGGLLAAAAAALYLSFLTRAYVFEGLARAMPIEVGRFRSVFNGNYLAYGFVGWCFHGALKSLGATLLSVVSLQIMDSLFGAAGLGVFFLTLRRLGIARPWAAVWAAALGLCLGYWNWSVDAQNYIFSTFLLQVNFHFLVAYAQGKRFNPAWLGALHALAVMGHIVNMLFALVVVWFLVAVHGKDWRKPVARAAAASAFLIAAAYLSIFAFIVRPTDQRAALIWFMGSLTGPGGAPQWHGVHGYGIEALLTWAKMTLNIFVSFAPVYSKPAAWTGSGALLAAARAGLALLAVKLLLELRGLRGLRRTAAIGCGIWLAAYAAVFTSWEPHTMVYRVSDLVPLLALLAIGAEAPSPARSWWRAAAAVWALFLGAGNFAAEVYPRSFAANNPHLMRMEFLKANTAEGDWVATLGGGAEELYIPFFAERRPIMLWTYARRLGELTVLFNALLDHGQSVYVTSRVLEDGQWRDFFSAFRLEPLARDGEGFEIYRLARGRGAR